MNTIFRNLKFPTRITMHKIPVINVLRKILHLPNYILCNYKFEAGKSLLKFEQKFNSEITLIQVLSRKSKSRASHFIIYFIFPDSLFTATSLWH